MKINFEQSNLIKPLAHKKICSLCGLENAKEYGNCAYCNAGLSAKYAKVKSPGSNRGAKRHIFLLFLFVLILFLIMALLKKYSGS